MANSFSHDIRRWIVLLEDVDTSLQKKYDHYNRLLFDGILPPIPIIWANLKNVGGIAIAKLIPDPTTQRATPLQIKLGLKDKYSGQKVDPASIAIKLSSTHKRSEQATDAILIHEMIHVYFYVTGRPGEYHGLMFMEQVRRCSQLVGFEIPMTESLVGLEVNDKLATKLIDLGVVYGRKKGSGAEIYAVFPANVVRANEALMIEKVSWNVTYNYWRYGWIGTIRSHPWTDQSLKTPVQRKWSGRYYFLRDATLAADLKQNGVELFSSGEDIT
jgi:hypothetical protein